MSTSEFKRYIAKDRLKGEGQRVYYAVELTSREIAYTLPSELGVIFDTEFSSFGWYEPAYGLFNACRIGEIFMWPINYPEDRKKKILSKEVFEKFYKELLPYPGKDKLDEDYRNSHR